MMITLKEYLMGRDSLYQAEYTEEIRANSQATVDNANRVIAMLEAAGVLIEARPDGTLVNSGWRPPLVNAKTAGAAPNSNHMVGLAVDIFDPHGAIDAYFMSPDNTSLEDMDMYIEAPDATPGWSHWQFVPPHSGKRVFNP